jgi:hypothetical protein
MRAVCSASHEQPGTLPPPPSPSSLPPTHGVPRIVALCGVKYPAARGAISGGAPHSPLPCPADSPLGRVEAGAGEVVHECVLERGGLHHFDGHCGDGGGPTGGGGWAWRGGKNASGVIAPTARHPPPSTRAHRHMSRWPHAGVPGGCARARCGPGGGGRAWRGGKNASGVIATPRDRAAESGTGGGLQRMAWRHRWGERPRKGAGVAASCGAAHDPLPHERTRGLQPHVHDWHRMSHADACMVRRAPTDLCRTRLCRRRRRGST